METKPDTELSLAEARAMLGRTAGFLDLLRGFISRALETVSVQEARAVFVEERPVDVVPAVKPQQRPRGGAHPLLMLMRLGETVARLQERVLRTLFPDLKAPATAGVEEGAKALTGLVDQISGMAKQLGIDLDAA